MYAPRNPFVAVPTLGFIGGGAFIIKRYFSRMGEVSETIVLPGGRPKPVKEQFNSLCIYPDKIEFTNMTNPLGQPWKCLNDNKLYFVQIWDAVKNELIEFVLPDQQYMDPEYFAKRVLELPAHRRIFRRKQSLLEQLSPAMVIVGIIVFGIVMLTTLG